MFEINDENVAALSDDNATIDAVAQPIVTNRHINCGSNKKTITPYISITQRKAYENKLTDEEIIDEFLVYFNNLATRGYCRNSWKSELKSKMTL